MKNETRTAVYHRRLGVEAYRLAGIARPFPEHFHRYYVIGVVEAGRRTMRCKGRDYAVQPGDILLFGPGDSHACAQSGGGALDYRGFNIGKDAMLALAEAATGSRELPGFPVNVLRAREAARRLGAFHRRVMEGQGGEEELIPLLSLLLRQEGGPSPLREPDRREEVEAACALMEERLGERLSLDRLCREAGLSRSALLRAFVRSKGITPYRYLENLRVDRARQLLERGVPPAEAALATGFSDQSHFTNCFSRFIGLSPGAYREIFLDKEDG